MHNALAQQANKTQAYFRFGYVHSWPMWVCGGMSTLTPKIRCGS